MTTTIGQQQQEHVQQDGLCKFPVLNQKAPDFDALTTEGQKRLSDFEGKWLILFSHPSDFTPVCTTEFMAFAVNAEKFRKMDCELLGLSVDSHYSHIAWSRNIEEKFGIQINFPIIADINMKVSMDYGMIHPGASSTETVRSVFIIDPRSNLRAMLYYPMEVGRSVTEIMRLLASLQLTDEHGVKTPEGWKPGDNVIVAPPTSLTTANRRKDMAQADPNYRYSDWYFCERIMAPAPEARAQNQTDDDVNEKIPA
ncbi:MAG TPA: peroxiredoxin [Gammaproteobacteria bacterium]|nr:peroxiredoxin [Gammaproteobacteria bacterium]